MKRRPNGAHSHASPRSARRLTDRRKSVYKEEFAVGNCRGRGSTPCTKLGKIDTGSIVDDDNPEGIGKFFHVDLDATAGVLRAAVLGALDSMIDRISYKMSDRLKNRLQLGIDVGLFAKNPKLNKFSKSLRQALGDLGERPKQVSGRLLAETCSPLTERSGGRRCLRNGGA